MSRTKHHGYKRKLILFENSLRWHWWQVEPKWHRRIYKHKKRRAECRILCDKVMKGEEEQIWPLDKKPWIYYW